MKPSFHQLVVLGVGLIIAASLYTGAFGFAAVALAAVVFGADLVQAFLKGRDAHLAEEMARAERETGVIAQLQRRLERAEADADKFRLETKNLISNGRR